MRCRCGLEIAIKCGFRGGYGSYIGQRVWVWSRQGALRYEIRIFIRSLSTEFEVALVFLEG